MNYGLKRNFLRPGREARMASATLTDDMIGRVLGAAVSRLPTKRVARIARACERAVDNWRAGIVPKPWVKLIRLMREDDELCAAVLAMAGRSPTTLTDEQIAAMRQALNMLDGKR